MNLPNILTISRIVMVLIFVVLATLANVGWVDAHWVFTMRLTAYALAILAGATICWTAIWPAAGIRSLISER